MNMSMWYNNSHEKETKHFDICTPKQSGGAVVLKPALFARMREKRKEVKQSSKEIVVLRPGMVHLKGYISITDQVKIVKKCRELGLGDGGFYQPGYKNGTKLHLKMMCLGKNWDPQTSKYVDQRPSDGSIPPEIPDEFLTLVHSTLEASSSVTKLSNSKEISTFSPNICIVNFYSQNGRLGLHQDKDEGEASISAGLPVVSFSIGDSAEFLYGDERDVDRANKVVLESGDVLIFGGKARNVFHGISAIKPETAPRSLLEETNLRKPGRLELSFRKLIPDHGQGPPFNHHPLTPPPLLFPRSSTRWISWHPSREDCFVLNVDGSSLGDSGRAGAGGLIRKGDGTWVIGFSCFLGIADNTYAELMAVYHGLNLAIYNGCNDVRCYSDSKTVIDLISKPINSLHRHALIVAFIKELKSLDLKVKFSHTLREGNASANFLAKLGSSNDINMKIWNTPPEGIETLLLSDSRRTLHPRP